MNTVRLKLYRKFSKWFTGLISPRFQLPQPKDLRSENATRLWIHAASQELESLWLIALEWAKRGNELIITVFSDSAIQRVEKLKNEILISGGKIIWSGYSPREGQWEPAFFQLKPSIFLTAKYEAWPELWAAASNHKVPIVIVGAKPRKSLKLAKFVCKILGIGLPKLTFLTALETDRQPLQILFPKAVIKQVGEPRWDRVIERSRIGNSRTRWIIQQTCDLQGPRGVLGSIWPADLKIWGEILRKLTGVLFIVPHRIEEGFLRELETLLRKLNLNPQRTSVLGENTPLSDKNIKCLLVDEMGFLLELYSVADWAYVGGGFGAGVHSTIEPAVYGIPIAAGPARADGFSEITELKESGQLTLVTNKLDLDVWVHENDGLGKINEKKGIWRDQAFRRGGASQRTVRVLDALVLNNGERLACKPDDAIVIAEKRNTNSSKEVGND